MKEVIINDIDLGVASQCLDSLVLSARMAASSLPASPRDYFRFWTEGVDVRTINTIAERVDDTVEYIHDTRDSKVIGFLNKIPVILFPWTLAPLGGCMWVRKAVGWCFPVGMPLFAIASFSMNRLKKELETLAEVCSSLKVCLSDESVE